MDKIIILVCYFGEWPWYFKYFIHTCRYNPNVEFVIITDNENPVDAVPKNVSIVGTTIEDFKMRAERKLDLAINFSDPYKINDFKPAYGILFSDFVSGYDFWGHADIDLIFGNIRNFITNEILDTYDVISVRHDHLTGFFTLFRNCSAINNLFKSSKDYKKVFTSERHFCFDETNFEYNCFTQNIPLEHVHTEIESMTEVVRRMHNEKLLNAYFDFHAMDILHGKLKWSNGTLLYKKKFEVMVYHLINLKKRYKPRFVKKIPQTFYISPTRIYS